MFRLPYNCVHSTHQQDNAQNPSNQASAVHKPRTSRCTSWIQKRQRIIDKAREFQKNTYCCFIDYAKKPQTMWITTNFENSERNGNTALPYLPPEKPVCRSRNNSQNWTQNNILVPNQERSTSGLYIVTFVQSTSYEMPGWIKHKLESRLLGEISITPDMQMTPPL